MSPSRSPCRTSSPPNPPHTLHLTTLSLRNRASPNPLPPPPPRRYLNDQREQILRAKMERHLADYEMMKEMRYAMSVVRVQVLIYALSRPLSKPYLSPYLNL